MSKWHILAGHILLPFTLQLVKPHQHYYMLLGTHFNSLLKQWQPRGQFLFHLMAVLHNLAGQSIYLGLSSTH